jgi:hypothetical protein
VVVPDESWRQNWPLAMYTVALGKRTERAVLAAGSCHSCINAHFKLTP